MAKRNFDSPEYQKFRKKVLRRDKWCCQMPNCKSRKKLQVHHIIPYFKANLLELNEYNAITLCRVCHESIWGKESFFISLFSGIVQRKYK